VITYVHCRKIYNLFVQAVETGRKANLWRVLACFAAIWIWNLFIFYTCQIDKNNLNKHCSNCFQWCHQRKGLWVIQSIKNRLLSIRGRSHQLDSTKKRLSSDQCILCHDLIFHPIWSRAHWSLAVLWCIGSSRHFIGILARNLALLRCLLTVHLLMRQLTIHRPLSMFAVLNGCCLASLLRSLSSLGVVFRGFPVLWRSFTLPVWFTLGV
jgi:hypothetical protein